MDQQQLCKRQINALYAKQGIIVLTQAWKQLISLQVPINVKLAFTAQLALNLQEQVLVQQVKNVQQVL